MKLINQFISSFTDWINFKSKASRLEFFIGLTASSFFFLLNILIFFQLNSYSGYLRSDTLSLISLVFIVIAILFAFVQWHSLLARRLNDISVNPYLAFVPFILASSYLLFKSFYDTDAYGHFIFIAILLVIVIYSSMMVSESD